MDHPSLDTSLPNVARMYDYMLGGRENFQADRSAAESVLRIFPETKQKVHENRAFLRRAVGYLSEQGICQFLDVGSGLPTQDNVHEVAHEVNPDAKVVYVDHDPVVVSHGNALLAKSEQVIVVQADFRDPQDCWASRPSAGISTSPSRSRLSSSRSCTLCPMRTTRRGSSPPSRMPCAPAVFS